MRPHINIDMNYMAENHAFRPTQGNKLNYIYRQTTTVMLLLFLRSHLTSNRKQQSAYHVGLSFQINHVSHMSRWPTLS